VGQLATLDAVTIDGYGTLLRLVDPLPKLRTLLPDRPVEVIAAAFRAEVEFYAEHAVGARDESSLARLHSDCTMVFNRAAGSRLTTEEYIGALEFELLPGVVEALTSLRARGLALAVVANWDFSLHAHLRRHGLHGWFDTVVTSAETGRRKPDPAPFRLALERLGVPPARALHVGDDPSDEKGAEAAGMRFAPVPLATALEAWV
jgi:HAD superfamily hydrolase (TIGR01509 family)